MIAIVAAAFERLIDYAGLFPPAQLEMHDAAEGYARAAEGPHAWMLGRFIVPAARIAHVEADVPLSVIVPAEEAAFDALDRARASGRYRIEALEIPPADARVVAALRERHGWAGVPAYAEVALTGPFEEAIASLRPLRLAAKFRCGGITADAFPSVETLARAIAAAAAAGVPFKATAGLHHPVRHFNEEAGLRMHGFLNVMLAAARAGQGPDALAAILAEEEPAALALPDAGVVADARRRFVSYGSCSFDEPVADLQALGLIA